MHVAVPPRFERVVGRDNIVRDDTTLEALAALKPVFDRSYGTITAGNASPLTDGAAAVIVMSEEKARALGLTPLGYLRAYAYAALDPRDQLLQGPAYAAPIALDRAGLTLAGHGPRRHARGLRRPGALQPAGLRLQGLRREAAGPRRRRSARSTRPGSTSTAARSRSATPSRATGARMITQTLRELQRRRKQYALLTVCAAGALGAAVVLERE